MKLYALLDRVCPFSFAGKLFVIVFLGIHVPLIVMAGFLLWTHGFTAARVPELLLLTAATLTASVLTLLALKAVLQPLFQIKATRRGC